MNIYLLFAADGVVVWQVDDAVPAVVEPAFQGNFVLCQSWAPLLYSTPPDSYPMTIMSALLSSVHEHSCSIEMANAEQSRSMYWDCACSFAQIAVVEKVILGCG